MIANSIALMLAYKLRVGQQGQYCQVKWLAEVLEGQLVSAVWLLRFLRSRLESQSWTLSPLNKFLAGVSTPPDSGKTPQLETPKLHKTVVKPKFCISSLRNLLELWNRNSFPNVNDSVLNMYLYSLTGWNSGRHTQPDPQSCCVGV